MTHYGKLPADNSPISMTFPLLINIPCFLSYQTTFMKSHFIEMQNAHLGCIISVEICKCKLCGNRASFPIIGNEPVPENSERPQKHHVVECMIDQLQKYAYHGHQCHQEVKTEN